MIKKIIERGIHRESMRIGFLFLFMGLILEHAQETTPNQCVKTGLVLLAIGLLTSGWGKLNKTKIPLMLFLLLSVNSYATSLSMPYCSEATGGFIFASHWNGNCSAIQTWSNNQNIDGTTNIAVGGIQTANLANLSVTDAKIAGITTAGKVNGSAITAINNLPSGAGTIPTVNLGSNSASNINFLRGDQTWNNPFAYYVKVTNSQTAGTAGGAASTGSWLDLPLNTKDNDPAAIATLSGNAVSLPAGTYLVRATAVFVATGLSQMRIYNATTSAAIMYGQPVYTQANEGQTSAVFGEFTISGTTSVAEQYQVATHTNNNDLGDPANFGTEVYDIMEFQKVA